jgi:predicted nuclease of predicted toxin-antitoxin system
VTSSADPKKLVLVKLGNMRLKELKGYFERNAGKLIELLEEHSFIILEAGKIRVLE